LFGCQSRIEVGKEEFKQNPKKDLPEFPAIRAPLGYRSHKRLWFEKTLPQKLQQQAQRTREMAESNQGPDQQISAERTRLAEQERELADRLARLRRNIKK